MYKDLFPLLKNRAIHYLDAAATAQRPESVLHGVREYYLLHNGNAGRGSHTLAMESSALVEESRKAVCDFIRGGAEGEVVFTKNATESLNIIAYCYALEMLQEGDEILISVANHHANLVTWQYAAQKTGAKLVYTYPDKNGNFDTADFEQKISVHTKIVAVSAAVNTTGVVNPVEYIVKKAHEAGAVAVIDAAQSIVHFQHEVEKWDCDFLVFSAHKLYAEFGAGVLYAKKELLQKMPPFLYGGSMIDFVTEQTSEYKTGAEKYEGGTLDAAAIYSLKLAIDFVNTIGWSAMHSYLQELDGYLLKKLRSLDFVELYHVDAAERLPVVAFNVRNVHSHDTAYILNEYNVMVRSGHHCTQPLMKFMGVHSCCRASLGLYNTKEDIDRLVEGLEKVQAVFGQQ